MSATYADLEIKVHEIYRTLMGESSYAGLPGIIVRLAGCDLECAWCDTAAAAADQKGKVITIAAIIAKVSALGTRLVCLTGGEPLLQKHTPTLAGVLSAAGYTVLLETNGCRDIAAVGEPVVRIVDIKCPSSRMSRHTNWYNLQQLRAADELKFVVANREDYEYAREVVEKHCLAERCHLLFSPLNHPAGEVTPDLLAEWLLWDDLNARLQVQLHKIIWPEGEPKQ